MAEFQRQTVCCCVSDLEVSRSSAVSPSASNARVLLPAYIAHPKNGSLVPEELPGVCSSLTSSSFIPICKVNNIQHGFDSGWKRKELCASDRALFGPKWWLSSKTSVGKLLYVVLGLWYQRRCSSAQLNQECSRVCQLSVHGNTFEYPKSEMLTAVRIYLLWIIFKYLFEPIQICRTKTKQRWKLLKNMLGLLIHSWSKCSTCSTF